MLDLILEHDVQPESIDSIRLGTTSNILAALRYHEPMNELEAKFSIPFCLAVLGLYRRGGIAQFTDQVVLHPEVRQMMGRVIAYLHEDLEAQGFQRIRSLLEIMLRDGTVLTKTAETSRGTPDRPMTSDELAEKFMDCSQGILSSAAADECLDLIMGLEEISHIDRLTGLLCG